MRNRSGIWSSRHWVVAMLLPVLVVVTQVGCSPTEPTPPPNIVVNGAPITIIIGGTPGTSPSPGAAGGAVAAVTINGFHEGENCPPGTEKANAEKTVRAGCTLDVTVNPRNAQNQVIRDTSVTGLAPDYFSRKPGEDETVAEFRQDGGNLYNGRITAKKGGTITLRASVKGVPSGDVVFSVIP